MELLLKIENLSQYIPRQWLIIFGGVLFILGLHIWLFGITRARLWSFVIWAIIATSISGYFIKTKVELVAIIAISAGLLSAFFFKKAFAVFVALLAGVIFLITVCGLDIGASAVKTFEVSKPDSGSFYSLPELGRVVVELNTALLDAIRNVAGNIDRNAMLLGSLVSLTVFVAATFLSRMVCAIGISFIGSLSIAIGLIVLLFAKPSVPITEYTKNYELSSCILLGLFALGFFVQYLVVPVKKKKRASKEEKEALVEEREEESEG